MTRVMQPVRAEVVATVLGRRAWVWLIVAVFGSAVSGLISGGLLSQMSSASAIEQATVIVARGSAAQIAIVVLASAGIAGAYRDGSWMHAALACPNAARRLGIGLAAVLPITVALGAVSAVAAIAGAAPFARADPPALVIAIGLQLLISGIWGLWIISLAHAVRSPLVVLAIGLGLPLVVEPGLGGGFALAGVDGLRWLLPGQALRAVAERAAGEGAVLAGVEDAALVTAILATVGWSALALAGAWWRMRGAQPR